MKRKILLSLSVVLVILGVLGTAGWAQPAKKGDADNPGSGAAGKRVTVYHGDEINVSLKGYVPKAQYVKYGTNVAGQLFDGYPEIVKEEATKPTYKVKTIKNIMVPMRDGVRLAVDIYMPDPDNGQKFPALLADGVWGKDLQESIAWTADYPQPYYYSPFWDGTMEAGNYMYTVPRGYVHVIPDPRGMGNSEGYGTQGGYADGQAKDIYDVIEWIAAQPWSNGKVGMMGPSAYSMSQAAVAPLRPPHLTAIHMDEGIGGVYGNYFNGIWDTLSYHIMVGRHGNDSAFVTPNSEYTPLAPRHFGLPKEELDRLVKEALNDPDIKYNSKWYSMIVYPRKHPETFDWLLDSLHPKPIPVRKVENIDIPTFIGTPWDTRLYIWGCFYFWDHVQLPNDQKRLMIYPPGFPPRPYNTYHDNIVRWFDYWLKGIDTGVKYEPPVKIFVMGINKWKFENEWPLARTQWTDYYLQPGGGLSTQPAKDDRPESFTQPAPYRDPTVYSIRYNTGPLKKDMEVSGPIALYLDAAIDQDDTNWIVDLVDVDPQGHRQWVSTGQLKAKFRAIDESTSKLYRPVHPRQEPVPVTPGEVVEYPITMMDTSVVFQKGHSMELIIRNQDDLLSRLGTWGVYFLPFMENVTHTIHFGKSRLLLPVIPAGESETAQMKKQ